MPLPRLLLPAFLFCAASAFAGDWYVATDGNDAWSGKLPAPNAAHSDGPFASLAKARDAVRADTGARTVHLREGLYALPQGLAFGVQDSGTAQFPVTWEAFEKEHPLLIGGRAITGWKPWKDGILQADVGAQGFRSAAFKQLLFKRERQILARYPNFDPKNPYGGGWAYADGEMTPMYADQPGEDRRTLKVKPRDWRAWSKPEDVEVFVFPRFNWWNNILRVKSADAEKHTITTAGDASYGMRAGDRFYFQGALEDLDAPGEWALDRQTWTLYFLPPSPIGDSPVYAPTTRDILKFEGTDYLTVRGLAFECAEGSALALSKTNHCQVIGCTVRNVGDYSGTGISVNGGTDNGVIGCDVHHTGSNGIALSGGDRMTLTAAGNYADNCYIHHVGVYYKQGVGVALSGVGQRVSHCLIHDTPRFAIQFAGNNHILEYNHLRHVALETEDVGATYCGGRDWISPRGSVIRYNYIHDVLGYGWNGKWTSPYFAWGIYLDDNSGGVDVIGNIVARCGRSLIHGHSARDCRVENNIFVEGGLRQWEFNGWVTTNRFWETTLPQMLAGYESVAKEPAWKGMRGMAVNPKDIPDKEGRVMSGDVFTRNIIAWKNPEARALNVVAFNSARNDFDHNLYWHYGLPLLTGQHKSGKTIGANLAPNPRFEQGEAGKLPADWSWQIRPKPEAVAARVEDGSRQCLRIDAARNPDKPRDNYPIVASKEIELKSGASYRVMAKMRSDQAGAKASLLVQSWIPAKDGKPAHFWGSSPSEVRLETQWKDYDFTFTVPAPGDKGWNVQMKMYRIRFDWPAETGSLFATDVWLEEVEALNEWQSWQALGGDLHSVIADPKFIAPGKDDYRLAADSPAWALGFKPIPVERIGPYESPDRATWPIVEAEGARERPLTGP